jgi:biotin carboxyl carrier protein
MYKASVNEKVFEIELGDITSVNGQITKTEFSHTEDKSYSLQINGTLKEADLVKLDKENKIITLRIEGKKYNIAIKEPIDLLMDRLGINQKVSKKINNLKAPMPGLVAKILVSKGDKIKSGEPLLILEAMKMENVFKAAADVIIKDIHIEEKQSVEKGTILMSFE